MRPDQIARICVGAAFTIAGVLKSWNIAPLVKVVYFLLPSPLDLSYLGLAIGLLVIMTEIVLGVQMLFGRWDRPIRLVSLACVLFFSLALVPLALIRNAPSCGCFGLFGSSSNDALIGLVRNGMLIGLIVFFPRSSFSNSAELNRQSDLSNANAPASSRGFSLVEMFVVVVICATLISLLLPAISAARQHARGVKAAATQRELLTVLALYADDFKSSFPYAHTSGNPAMPAIIAGFKLERTSYFGSGSVFWVNILGDGYFRAPAQMVSNPTEDARVNRSDGYPEHMIRSEHLLSFTCFADASFWSDQYAASSASFRAVRHYESQFPSQKGVLLQAVNSYASGGKRFTSRVAGCADGSAFIADLTRTPSSLYVKRDEFGAYSTCGPVMTTYRGMAGFDFPVR
jgi:hypothetical protein